MAHYERQVLIVNGCEREWKSTRPTHGTPYRFDTFEEAFDELSHAYPDEIYGEHVRVIKIG